MAVLKNIATSSWTHRDGDAVVFPVCSHQYDVAVIEVEPFHALKNLC